MSKYPIQVKIWKWLKLLNSVQFIKKPLVNQICIWIWSFWLTFTVLQWMKRNSKNSQFSSFLLRSGYAILVKIWKWLKLLNSVPFIKKRLLNHVYIQIWSSWLTFKVSQGMKANIKISQFSRFLLRSDYPIQVKIWKSLKQKTWKFLTIFDYFWLFLTIFDYFWLFLTIFDYLWLFLTIFDYFCSFSLFTVKLWKSVNMIKFKCKLDLQVVSWWMVHN